MLHYTVLLNEAVELLKINPSGVYIDGTFGRGGHSAAVLEKLDKHGRLIAFDKDIEAIEYGKLHIQDDRFLLFHDSFSNLDQHLARLSIKGIDGVLLDLGVSSPQLDNRGRGFSFRFDSELDMRMDNTRGISCKEWINGAEKTDLTRVFREYGEERFASRIAANIVRQRALKPIVTTFDLVKIVEQSLPIREKGQHPATRVFQALRIFINNELGDLELALAKLPKLLNIGARVVVISFHSLEDRIVKNCFNSLSRPEHLPKWINVAQKLPEYNVIAKKVKAGIKEINENTRSRSAILRALERIDKKS